MARQGKTYKPTDADRKFVERAVMAGSRIEDIASALNIHDDTLRKHFRYEIMTSRERLKGEAVRVLMDSLTDGSLDAAKFVLARQAGWAERQAVDMTGNLTVKDERSPDEIAEQIASKLASIAAARGKE